MHWLYGRCGSVSVRSLIYGSATGEERCDGGQDGVKARSLGRQVLVAVALLMFVRGTGTALLILIMILEFLPTGAPAMELKIVGNQIILSGPVVGDEPEKVREALVSSPSIDTVILRNSPGGNAPSGYQVGQLLRERKLRTAVSGYCYSSCSRMFLGGSTRYFTDDYLPESNNVGFHGHYDRMGRLNTDLVRQYGLRDWIIKYSDGKADPLLVERWINIPYSRGMIHFFHPGLVERARASTFMCQGDEGPRSVFACQPIAKTALDLGIITSLDLVHCADR